MGNSNGSGINELHWYPEYGKVTKLLKAVAGRELSEIKLLMLSGADPNVKFKRKITNKRFVQWTAIHEACRCQNESQKNSYEQEEMLRLLTLNPVDLNARGHLNVTPLHVAVFHGHHNLVKMLIQSGCNIDKEDAFGETALSIACIHGETEIVITLLNAGCNMRCYSWGSSWYEDSFVTGRRRSTKNFRKFICRKLNKIPYYGYLDKRPINEVVINLNWTLLGQILIANGARTSFCPKDFMLYVEYKYDTDKHELEQLFDMLYAVDCVFREDQMKYIINKDHKKCHLRDKVLYYVYGNEVKPLMHICRSVIRNSLIKHRNNRSIYPSISKFSLPTALKDYIALKTCSYALDKSRICLSRH